MLLNGRRLRWRPRQCACFPTTARPPPTASATAATYLLFVVQYEKGRYMYSEYALWTRFVPVIR